MEFSLEKKIAAIRHQPEEVRKRYVMLCVSFSMVLIVGIWLLSVQDSVTTAAKDLPGTLEKGKDLTGGAPSLNDLFKQSSPLRVENQGVSGSEFFDRGLNGKNGTTQGEETAPSK